MPKESFLPFSQLFSRLCSAEQHPTEELSAHIVVGVTHSQTCMVLRGRLRALREAGFRVTLICSPGELAERLAAEEGAEYRPLSICRKIAPLRDAVAFVRMLLLLLRLRPQICEFSTPKAGLLGSVAARIVGVPTRIYMLRGLRLEASRGLERRILLACERLAAHCAQKVLCNSESLHHQALELRLAPPEKLCVLGTGSSNGVDVTHYVPGPESLRKQLRIPKKAPVIGFVGRFTYAKGIPDLLEAFERVLQTLPRAHLLLVGWFDAAEDALSPAWKQRILRHPRIHATGMASDCAPYYRAMDLLALPSWREGFPNAVLEAAASGIPTVTTLATGACDSVVEEETGLLVAPGYPSALCEAILRLLEQPVRLRRMGRAARARAIAQFSSETVLRRTVEFYQGLTLRNSRALREGTKSTAEASAAAAAIC